MAEQVTGTIGDQDVVLENAASEATLERILQAMGGGSAGGSAGGAASKLGQTQKKLAAATAKAIPSIAELDREANKAGKTLGETVTNIANKAGLVSKTFTDLAKGGQGASDSLKGFTKQVGDGASKFGVLGGAVGGLITGVGAVLAAGLGALDKTDAMFNDVVKSGAAFGGSLTRFRQVATSSGYTMEQFAGAIKANTAGLATFGGSSTAGANALAGIMKATRNTGLAQTLQSMGVSMKEQPEFMADYMSQLAATGRSLKDFGGDFNAVALAAGRYKKDLIELAEITGTSAAEQKKNLDAQKLDAQFQAQLAGMSKEQGDQVRALMASMSPLEQEMLKQQLAFGGLRGETASAGAMFPGLAGQVADLANGVKSGEQDLTGLYKQSGRARQAQIAGDLDRNKQMIAFGAGNKAMNDAYLVSMKKRQIDYNKAEANGSDQRNKLDKQAAKANEARNNFLTSLERIGNALMSNDGFIKFLEVMTTAIEGVANTITGLIGYLGPNGFAGAIIAATTALFALKASRAAGLVGGGRGRAAGLVGGGRAAAGKGAGAGIAGIGRGMGAGLKGMAVGLKALANPMALVGLAAITLAVMGIAKAAQIAAPAFEPLGKMFKSVFEGLAPLVTSVMDGISNFVSSVGGSIKGVIEGIGNSIATVVDSITNMKTAGVNATTEQIERLSKIPAGQMFLAADGIERMKAALEGFAPGFLGGLSQGLGSVLGGDQADKIVRLAEAGAKLNTGISTLDMKKFDLTAGIEDRYKVFADEVERVARATNSMKPSVLENGLNFLSSLNPFSSAPAPNAASATAAPATATTPAEASMSINDIQAKQLELLQTLVEITENGFDENESLLTRISRN